MEWWKTAGMGVQPVNTTRPGAQIVRTLEQLRQVQSLWEAVPVSWANPAMSYEFVNACAEAYGIADRLSVVVSTSGPHPAIAPLYRSEAAPRLELVGQNQIFEASDFLYAAADDLPGLASAVITLGRPLRLNRIPEQSATVAALEAAYRGRGLVVKRPAAGCPWIALDESWAEPDQHLNSGRRSDLRRLRRNAEKLGAVTFDVCSPQPQELEALLGEVYAVESAGWKARSGSAMEVDPRMGAFYKSYAAAAAAGNVLRLAFMRIDGRPVAAQLAIEAGGAYWLLKIGYVEEFKRCSPGILLMIETIRYAANAGLKSYEFLGAEEEWINAWKPNVRSCIRLQTYPFNFHGASALLGDTLANLRSKLKTRIEAHRRNK
jgi:CelD/BcsL family acetyltransferase involved in cellulose biosynthesis